MMSSDMKDFTPALLEALKISPEPVTLSYSDHEPLGNMRTKFLNDVFFPAVEKESNGRIKIIRHWNGKTSTSYKALQTVQNGKDAQIFVVVPEYFMDALTLHSLGNRQCRQVFKSFPVGPTGNEQVNFFRGIHKKIPALQSEIDQQNLHVIFIATGYLAGFFPRAPLNDLRDIAGQKWRSASFWHKDFLQNAGAIPVTMPWGKGVFEALENGTLGGLIVNIDSGFDIKAHTAPRCGFPSDAKNIAFSPKLWLGHAYLIAMNNDVWEKLSDDDRAAFERAANFAYSKLGDVMTSALQEQVRALEAEGASVRILSDEEISAWESMTNYEAIQDKWADKNSGAHEVLNAVYAESFRK